MVNYTCPNCNKEFKQKQHYIEHTQYKKKPCQSFNELNLPKFTDLNQNLPKFTENNPKHECKYCNKTFTTIYTLKRHLERRCKIKKEEDDEKKNEINELKNQNKMILKHFEEFKKMMESQKSNPQSINNGTINNNIIIPQEKLVNFGSEDLSKIETGDFFKMLNDKEYGGIIGCTRLIHGNSKLPQYKNCYVADYDRKKAYIYDNGWKLRNVEVIISKLMSHITNLAGNLIDRVTDSKYKNKEDIIKAIKKKVINKVRMYEGDDMDDEDDEVLNDKETKEFIKNIDAAIYRELYNMREDTEKNYNNLMNIDIFEPKQLTF